MTLLKDKVAGLRRPKLLVRAARIGMPDYDRDRDLGRLMGTARPPAPDIAVRRLIDAENTLEHTRKDGDASYSVVRHVEVLTALMAETRLLPEL